MTAVETATSAQIFRITSASQVRQRAEPRWEDVEVPEWREGDGPVPVVRMWELDGAQRDVFDVALADSRSKGNAKNGKRGSINFKGVRVKLIIMSAGDESGNRIFSEEDFGWLSKTGGAAITRLYMAGARLSGLLPDSIEEEIENLDLDQSEPSASDSLLPLEA